MIVKDPIIYCDRPGFRALNLRPFGIDCVPYLGNSVFHERHRGTVFHVHPNCTEICLCNKGRLLFESEGREFNFLPKSVFVSGPDQPHRMRSNPKGLSVMSLLLAHPRGRGTILGLPRDESQRLLDAVNHLPRRVFAATDRVSDAFQRIFALYDATRNDAIIQRLEMRCTILDLLLAVVEASTLAVPKVPVKLKNVAERMRRHPQLDYPLADIAREIGMSEFNTTKIFKRAIGLPPHAWLIECRINAAQKMLSDGATSISAISEQLGFSSPQHFSNAFHNSVGVSPRAWRKRSQRKK